MSPIKEPRNFAPTISKYFGAKRMSQERYLKFFCSDQVKVIIFEEFIKNTKIAEQDVLKLKELLQCSLLWPIGAE